MADWLKKITNSLLVILTLLSPHRNTPRNQPITKITLVTTPFSYNDLKSNILPFLFRRDAAFFCAMNTTSSAGTTNYFCVKLQFFCVVLLVWL